MTITTPTTIINNIQIVQLIIWWRMGAFQVVSVRRSIIYLFIHSIIIYHYRLYYSSCHHQMENWLIPFSIPFYYRNLYYNLTPFEIGKEIIVIVLWTPSKPDQFSGLTRWFIKVLFDLITIIITNLSILINNPQKNHVGTNNACHSPLKSLLNYSLKTLVWRLWKVGTERTSTKV